MCIRDSLTPAASYITTNANIVAIPNIGEFNPSLFPTIVAKLVTTAEWPAFFRKNLERMKRAVIDPQKCIGCGACFAVCPTHAIKMMPGWRCAAEGAKCIGCGRCVLLCHKQAPRIETYS